MAVDNVNGRDTLNDAGKLTLRDIIHDFREVLRTSEHLQRKIKLGLDHPMVNVPRHHF